MQSIGLCLHRRNTRFLGKKISIRAMLNFLLRRKTIYRGRKVKQYEIAQLDLCFAQTLVGEA